MRRSITGTRSRHSVSAGPRAKSSAAFRERSGAPLQRPLASVATSATLHRDRASGPCCPGLTPTRPRRGLAPSPHAHGAAIRPRTPRPVGRGAQPPVDKATEADRPPPHRRQVERARYMDPIFGRLSFRHPEYLGADAPVVDTAEDMDLIRQPTDFSGSFLRAVISTQDPPKSAPGNGSPTWAGKSIPRAHAAPGAPERGIAPPIHHRKRHGQPDEVVDGKVRLEAGRLPARAPQGAGTRGDTAWTRVFLGPADSLSGTRLHQGFGLFHVITAAGLPPDSALWYRDFIAEFDRADP